jgi:hypothetical protein
MPMVRVLVAHEPATYREALGAALRLVRPDADVFVVAPENLDNEVRRVRPDLVFCSQLSELVRTQPRAWVLLYPGGEHLVETSVAGERITSGDLPFDTVIALVDQAASITS